MFTFVINIATNEYLEEINLSWNHLRQKGAFAIAKALKVCISIIFKLLAVKNKLIVYNI